MSSSPDDPASSHHGMIPGEITSRHSSTDDGIWDSEADENDAQVYDAAFERHIVHRVELKYVFAHDLGERHPTIGIPASTAYQPLPECHMRLLRISRASDSSTEIICQSEVHAVSTDARYTALSYQWGAGSTGQYSVSVNGGRVGIGKNLLRFLHTATASQDLRCDLYYIDAICINQADIAERSSQVQHMAQIFSTAHRVICWLGPAHHHSNEVMQYLEGLGQSVSSRKAKHVWSSGLGTAIAQFCRRAYWTRLWVVQELLLAQHIDVLCGSMTVPWGRLQLLHEQMDADQHDPRLRSPFDFATTHRSPANAMIKRIMKRQEYDTLSNMMLETKTLRCALDLDKAYALLGAMGSRTSIVPDYSIPVHALLNALVSEHWRVEPPKNLDDAITYCQRLSRVLNGNPHTIFSLVAYDGHEIVPSMGDMQQCPMAYLDTGITLWWSQFYGHDGITRLLLGIHGFVSTNLDLAVSQNHPRAVKMLLDLDASTINDNINNEQDTLLTYAVDEGCEDVVKLLLQYPHCDVNRRVGDEGSDALMRAALWGHTAIAEALLSRNDTRIDAEDSSGNTAFMIAASNGRVDILRALLRAGYDSTLRINSDGETALDLAVSTDHACVAQLLLSAHRDREAELMLHLNARERYLGTTLLLSAAQCSTAENVELLLETASRYGMTLSTAADETGWTPLHYAAAYGCAATVKILLELDITQVFELNDKNATPLMCARQSKKARPDLTELISMLEIASSKNGARHRAE